MRSDAGFNIPTKFCYCPPPDAGSDGNKKKTQALCLSLLFVGVPRFELGTPCSQSRCANRTALHPVQMAFCSFASAKIRLFIGYLQGKRAFFGSKSTNNLEAGEFYQEFLVARCLEMHVYLGAVPHSVDAHHSAAPETLVHNDAAGFHAACSLCCLG